LNNAEEKLANFHFDLGLFADDYPCEALPFAGQIDEWHETRQIHE
jgi:hypothetical protein